jgi:hypothetical protein
MGRLTVIYWRDIPAQVIGQQGRRRHRQELPARFATAIDRAAMRAGRGSSEAYLEDWRRETRPCAGDVADAVRAEAARLDASFSQTDLEAVVKAGGHKPNQEDPR